MGPTLRRLVEDEALNQVLENRPFALDLVDPNI